MTDYEMKALLYAEKYGIIEYHVNGSKMTYYESYPNEGKFKHVINLTNMTHSSKKVKFIRKPFTARNG